MDKNKEEQAFRKALAENKYDEALHRVFADWLEEQGYDDDALFHRTWTPEWQRAWDAMEKLARDNGEGASVEELLAAGRTFLDQNGLTTTVGFMGFGLSELDFENEGVRQEFWKNFSIIEKREVDEETAREAWPFNCCGQEGLR